MYLKAIVGVIIFLAIAAGYALNLSVFSNTFDSLYLFFRALLMGGAAGFVVGRYLKDKSALMEEKIGIFAGCILVGMIIFPLIAIITNNNISVGNPLSMKVKFIRSEPLITSRFGLVRGINDNIEAYYTYFLKDGEQQRLRTKKPIFEDVEKGAEVELPIKKGLWGFYHIDVK